MQTRNRPLTTIPGMRWRDRLERLNREGERLREPKHVLELGFAGTLALPKKRF